jgi:HSP20 family protein
MRLIPYFSQTPSTPIRSLLTEPHPDVNELLRSFWGVDATETRAWAPRLDVHEGKDAYSIQADLPGVDKKDIQVTVEDGILSLRGERRSLRDEKADDGSWQRLERHSGSFQRSLRLGEGIDSAGIKAQVKDGVLSITVPKKEAAKAQVIQIG